MPDRNRVWLADTPQPLLKGRLEQARRRVKAVTLPESARAIMRHASAPGQSFIVAVIKGKIVGAGALIYEGERVGRIVRMSVARGERRKANGQALIAHLRQRARERGFTRLVLETNLAWDDTMSFYQRCGFSEERRTDRLAHLGP